MPYRKKKRPIGRPRSGFNHKLVVKVNERQLRFIERVIGEKSTYSQAVREMIDDCSERWGNNRRLSV